MTTTKRKSPPKTVGRPALPEGERAITVNVSLKPRHRSMLRDLGGSAWLQAAIDTHHAILMPTNPKTGKTTK